MNINFNQIDLKTWSRAQQFYYFTQMLPVGYSITVEVDITQTLKHLKQINKKFFPTYLYLVTKIIGQQENFKVAYKDEVLGYYDTLTPMYASFHEDDKTVSIMWTEYDEIFATFYTNYVQDQEKYGDVHGILSKPDMPPANGYSVSCVPWIEFKSYTPISYENKKFYLPVVEAGKFFQKDGRTILPLSITVHHAVADGYHVNLFLEDFQRALDTPEEWAVLQE